MTPEHGEKAWWQTGSEKEFKRAVSEATSAQLQILSGEIGGALAVIRSQLQSRPEERLSDWGRRATQTVGFFARRRSVVKAELQARNEENQTQKQVRKVALIAAARQRIAEGDIAGSLEIILDLLEGGHAKKEGEA